MLLIHGTGGLNKLDAELFFIERERMCKATFHSGDCPIHAIPGWSCVDCDARTIIHYENIIQIVEQWSKENPIKTNGDMIIEFIRAKRHESLEGCDRQDEWHYEWTASIRQYFGSKWWDAPYEAPKEDNK